MLVYGDRESKEDAATIVKEIGKRLDQCSASGPGLSRHQALVAAFVRAAELVQSIADAQFHHIGADEISEHQERGNTVLWLLAAAIRQSWSSGFVAPLVLRPEIQTHLQALSLAGSVTTKQAEGYAFYAIYPEAYLQAAQFSGLGGDTMVIGIRSIGAGLAALVAAAIGAPPAVTVRPIGHPFDRKLALGEKLSQNLLAHQGPFAIADEGPGLSGSSFNSVADWLTERGVDESRIYFFPSHAGGLGQAAQQRHRQRWSGAKRHVVGFDELLVGTTNPAHQLANWVSELIGPLEVPLQDLSGGAWRGENPSLADFPADPALERRKFLASGREGQWLVKFAGIGGNGEAKLNLAHRLADAGFAPRPAGLCHGFLVMAWLTNEAAPNETVPRDRVLDYLAFRASLPPLGSGAGLGELFNMAQYNIGQRCGPAAAELVKKALGDPARFMPVPCCTDNRTHSWEWVKTAAGWFKLDGLDHHASHDLVGCQDIAWDLAGAAVELGLSQAERDSWTLELSRRIRRSIDTQFVAANELCYLGFQIGLWSMAQERNSHAEAARIEELLGRYATHRALSDLGITCVKS